jgi:hypothetical protein
MIVSPICYKSALTNVLDILTEEQIELVFSDLRILRYKLDENLSSIVKLPRCPEHLKEKYAIFLSKWFCGEEEVGGRDRWDRRGTSVYIRELREYVQYLPITEISRLTESISRFMKKPDSDDDEIKRARAFLNFLLKSSVS